MFTTHNTLNELLNHKDMRAWIHVLHREDLLDLITEKDLPLEESTAHIESNAVTGKRLRDSLVETANLVLELQAGERRCLKLHTWTDWVPEETTDLSGDNAAFLITARKTDNENRPIMLIVPGGGYDHVSPRNEGTPTLELAEKHGYASFMLTYSVAPLSYPSPQIDLLSAIRFIKTHAQEFHADPRRVALFGFSAGGHLCASSTHLYQELGFADARPDVLGLGYPVVSFDPSIAHEHSVKMLLKEPTEEMRKKLSVERMINEHTIPTFLWTCKTDRSVNPQNTIVLEEALRAHQVPHECHIYPDGRHGMGLGTGTSAEGWIDAFFKFLDQYL